MTVGERIKNRREACGISVIDLAERLGKARSTVYRYESDDVQDMPITVLEPLAKALSTTPAYLMGWVDDPNWRDTLEWKKATSIPPYENILPVRRKKVRLLGTIAAGEPIYADEDFESYVWADGNIHCDFALRASGDSMINARIYDGDIVFIRAQSDVDDGEIAAVVVDDTATLKRVYHIPGGVQLVAENSKYRPMIYTQENCDELRILGKAIAFQSDL